MNQHFSARLSCPCCKSTGSNTLCKVGYTESPVREYLESFYPPLRTGAEFAYVEGSDYILDECNHCGLIYQREVPNDRVMFKLYEEWLDPKRAVLIFSRGLGQAVWVALGVLPFVLTGQPAVYGVMALRGARSFAVQASSPAWTTLSGQIIPRHLRGDLGREIQE